MKELKLKLEEVDGNIAYVYAGMAIHNMVKLYGLYDTLQLIEYMLMKTTFEDCVKFEREVLERY